MRKLHRNGVECVHGKFLHEYCPVCEQIKHKSEFDKIKERHVKAETIDCYFVECGSNTKKEKVYCDAKTQAHRDRGLLIKMLEGQNHET